MVETELSLAPGEMRPIREPSVCRARVGRVQGTVARLRRLETILRKLERAYDPARDRAWIEAFIGPPLGEGKEVQG